MRKGTVGNNRKAERNVVKVNEQSRKNSGLKRAGRSDAFASALLRMGPPDSGDQSLGIAKVCWLTWNGTVLVQCKTSLSSSTG